MGDQGVVAARRTHVATEVHVLHVSQRFGRGRDRLDRGGVQNWGGRAVSIYQRNGTYCASGDREIGRTVEMCHCLDDAFGFVAIEHRMHPHVADIMDFRGHGCSSSSSRSSI